jgi:hypothetical protein
MARFVCDNCVELHKKHSYKKTFFKSITQVLIHLEREHKIHILDRHTYAYEKWYRVKLTTYEDAMRKKKTLPFKFFCGECNTQIRTRISLLKHISEAHNVTIWYERGVSKKRVYLNGLTRR